MDIPVAGQPVRSPEATEDEKLWANTHAKHKALHDHSSISAEFTVSNGHGGRLFSRAWWPKKGTPTALVFIAHGVNEHVGRYSGAANTLVEHGYGVFGHDHIGHGNSDGHKGDIESFSHCVDDFKQLVKIQRDVYPTLPCFIFGHSMGSLAAFHASYELEEENPGSIQGVIFSGCALVPGPSSASPFGLRCLFFLTQNETAAAVIGGLLAKLQPRGPLAPVIVDQLTHDKAELELLKEDMLHNPGPVLNRTGHEIMKACNRMRERLPSYKLPFLALHGAADTVTYPLGSTILFEEAGSPHKLIKFYPGFYHDILLEIGREEVVRDLCDFVTERLGSTSRGA